MSIGGFGFNFGQDFFKTLSVRRSSTAGTAGSQQQQPAGLPYAAPRTQPFYGAPGQVLGAPALGSGFGLGAPQLLGPPLQAPPGQQGSNGIFQMLFQLMTGFFQLIQGLFRPNYLPTQTQA